MFYGYLTDLSNFRGRFLCGTKDFTYLCRKIQKHENQRVQETSHYQDADPVGLQRNGFRLCCLLRRRS
jgi:hypothetical protein